MNQTLPSPILRLGGSTASPRETDIRPVAVDLINSLGGRTLPAGQSPSTLQVALSNFAASDTQLWQLKVAEQMMRQTNKQRTVPKVNPYMSH